MKYINNKIKNEIWRGLPFLKNVYIISNMGRVIRVDNQRLIKPYRKKSGYYDVKLTVEGKIKNYRIHRLVAMAFIDNPLNKSQVNHIDGDKSNNKVENLEWVTMYENLNHAAKIGLRKSSKMNCCDFYSLYLPLDVKPSYPTQKDMPMGGGMSFLS